MASVTIIYHKGCFDGYGALWAAQKTIDDQVVWSTTIPMAYGDPLPEIKDQRLYILDFSFPRDVMKKLADENIWLTCLDHHKTAQADLEGLELSNGLIVFDMNRSGAGLSWDHFHPGQPRPKLIDYIEDRDLWRFKMPHSKTIHTWIASYPKEGLTWDNLAIWLENDFHTCLQEGLAIERYHDQKVIEMAQQAAPQKVLDYVVPEVNVPYQYASDVLHRLLDLNPEAPFAVGWSEMADGTIRYSLRGRDSDDFDVSEVARQFGGGGHPKASGFEVKPGQLED